MTGQQRAMVGTFRARVLERDTAVAPPPDAAQRPDRAVIRPATRGDLRRLEPLLAPDVDHARRLSAGDVCLWARAPDGEPAGVQWVNLALHTDRYLGRWSKPDGHVAYTNQTLVAPRYRLRGLGPRLMLAALDTARAAGRARLRGVVLHDNRQMLRLAIGLGFAPVATVGGLRLGRHATLRLSRRERVG